ncbi:alpha/beta fold hydrolase [Candidatus Microgenomates bacterium]|nr:alpha/beta fold hydrolase [Candidatus Microgenomates bacterium]
MSKRIALLFIFILTIILLAIIGIVIRKTSKNNLASPGYLTENNNNVQELPVFIELLRKRSYPASEIIIEETLTAGINYQRYIASYKSDELKIYGLLTIPDLPKPVNGYPTIIFLHGYVSPQTYVTTNDYVATQDGLARSGFITFKPDLRGHGKSQGDATGAHFSESYIVDTLNAFSALKIYKNVDSEKIGIWGHSNGGEIGLRAMVVSKEIKAGVFWAGVVGSFQDMLETYNSRIPFMRRKAPDLVIKYGSPSANPTFWNKLDPYSYLGDVSGPIQLHHGTADSSVPVELSIHLKDALEKEGKIVELYQYDGADHNFSDNSFGMAMQRSIDFLKKYLSL